MYNLARGFIDLCANEQSDRQTDSETCSKVILRPQILGHVLDDGPICLPLLFIRYRLLGQKRFLLRRPDRLLHLHRLGLYTLCGLGLALRLVLYCPDF